MLKDQTQVDFLGIGVQKSATTWLWSILKTHYDIWMPPRKELHYFDRNILYPSPSWLYENEFSKRLNGLEEYNQAFRDKMAIELSSEFIGNDASKLKWYHRYYCENYSDQWYSSLFEEGKGKVKGEFTPSYSFLNQVDILRIYNLFPNIKIILMLRNPIERAWSQLRFEMQRNQVDINVDSGYQEVQRFIDSPLQEVRSDYNKMLDNWLSIIPKEQIFIGFYEEVFLNKKELIQKLCNFLSIDSKPILTNPVIHKKKNVSIELDIPGEIQRYLQRKYSNDLERLSMRLGSYATDWWHDNLQSQS